jgi:hypothetical protein
MAFGAPYRDGRRRRLLREDVTAAPAMRPGERPRERGRRDAKPRPTLMK